MAKNRKYKVIISDRAKLMLGEHVLFIRQVNKKAAEDAKNGIMAAMRSLSQIPQRFPFLGEMYVTQNKYHKMVVGKWDLVLYQICDDTVYVEYILDCRQDYGWLIR